MSQRTWRIFAQAMVLVSGLAIALMAQEPAAAGAATARVMVVNLYAGAVDLQLGEPVQFSVSALQSGNPTAWRPVAADTALVLFYHAAGDSAWRYYQDADGQPAGLRFPPGSLNVIRLGSDGGVDIIPLDEQADAIVADAGGQAAAPAAGKPLARAFFLNGTTAAFDVLSLRDADLGSVAEISALPPQAMSYLVPLPVGSYAARWDQGADSGLTLVKDQGGQSLVGLSDLDEGCCYLVMAIAAADPASRNQVKIWNLGSLAP